MHPTQIKILHIDSNHPSMLEKLHAAGFQNDLDYSSTRDGILEKIEGYHGIVIRSRFDLDSEFLAKASNLQFIARVGAGLESIDCDFAKAQNIKLISAPEGNRNAVGEHTLALLLALFNQLNVADAEIKAGHWNREKNRGHELDGKTVGIIGYGNMGKSFAKKLRGFDVSVLCYDVAPNVGDQNAKQVSLHELQASADVVSLHVPWTPLTNGMVNSQWIECFAKPFWLINTARGKNIDTADLANALRSCKILGAGLDVLEYEKSSFEKLYDQHNIPDALNYLLESENVLLTPHVAGWTYESNERLAQVIADKIIASYSSDEPAAAPVERVTGIGGIFFKSANSKQLIDWYGRHLGLKTDQYGSTFWWKDTAGNDCSTQWSPFSDSTEYFEPSHKQFMQNFRVRNLDLLLEELKAEGVTMAGTPESFDYGKFAWIMDPEGNKIELWEPNDSAFL